MKIKTPTKHHSSHFLKLVADARKNIQEISPLSLKEKIEKQKHQRFLLIDVREEHEWSLGHIPTAIHLSKGIIERDIEKMTPDLMTPIIVYCSGGFRSVLVAKNLNAMGYNNIYSLTDGLRGWGDAGFSIEK